MRHKSNNPKTVATTAPLRREERRGGFVRTSRRAAEHPQTQAAVMALNSHSYDDVWVVKEEVRENDTKILVVAPRLAVEECYRHKETAVARMRRIAGARADLEIARAGGRPSAATLNVIPFFEETDRIPIYTANGMTVTYSVERMPLL